jgi:hypothetical protein
MSDLFGGQHVAAWVDCAHPGCERHFERLFVERPGRDYTREIGEAAELAGWQIDWVTQPVQDADDRCPDHHLATQPAVRTVAEVRADRTPVGV